MENSSADSIPDVETTRSAEKEAIARLRSFLDSFRYFERPMKLIMNRRYSPERIMEAEGKRCVVAVSGLRYHELVIYFQVSGLSIQEVEPFQEYDTYIQIPIQKLNEVLERVLSGDENAFGDIAASGDCKLIGLKAPHDIMIFAEVFEELARNIGRLLPALREGKKGG